MTYSAEGEAWWRANGPRIKAKLTKAERYAQSMPQAALMVVDEVEAACDEHGWPDWWHRVERLKRDAQMHQDWRWG